MQQCPTCGSQNPDNAEVCADCGMELPGHSAAPKTPAAAPQTPTPPQTPAAAPFDFAPEATPAHGTPAHGTPAHGTPAPAPAPAPVEASGTDPFAGSNWDFDLDKSGAASHPVSVPQSALEPAIVPDSPVENVAPLLPKAGTSEATQVVEPAAPVSPTPVPASGGVGSAKLILKRGGALTGDVFPIGPSATIGRFDPESGPVDVDMANLPEAVYISRHHAELNLRDGQWMVKDLGSRNGTFVKNAAGFNRVTGETPVQSGDEVAFGNARFEFQIA